MREFSSNSKRLKFSVDLTFTQTLIMPLSLVPSNNHTKNSNDLDTSSVIHISPFSTSTFNPSHTGVHFLEVSTQFFLVSTLGLKPEENDKLRSTESLMFFP